MSSQNQYPVWGQFPFIIGNHPLSSGKSWLNRLYTSSTLYQKLLDDFEVPDEVMQPMSHYTNRKSWESPYGPKYQQKGGEITVTTIKSTDNLPPKKWVLPRFDEKTREERTARRREMLAWLTEQKFKYQVCLVQIDKKEREVFLFKKEKLALMFKLAWG